MTECFLTRTSVLRSGKWLYILFHAIVQKLSAIAGTKSELTSVQEINRAVINQKAETILDTYGNSILRYAYSYLHNMSDAEEVLQDTLFRFLKTAPSFENAQHEKAWLLRVAANLSKNRIEYNALRKTDELNEELIAEQREDLSFVWEAVRTLPAKYSEVIHLFYFEGYSTKQISNILKINEVTVRSHLYRGRTRLKELLKEEYDFE